MSKDLVADMFNTIKVYEMKGKRECTVPYSKLIGNILKAMKEHGYIGDYEYVDDGKGGYFKVKLVGRINNCAAIKPRMPVKAKEWVDMERKYLLGVNVGIIIVSTPKGVMTNREARKQNIGGRLLGFVY